MQSFEQAVMSIYRKDQRFAPQAYLFLKEALDFTQKRITDTKSKKTSHHVTGAQLVEGFRDLALEQFGPMAATLIHEWGIRQTLDLGDMVFLLIETGIFGKQDDDKPEDFANVLDLNTSLRQPFLPKSTKNT